VVGQVENGKEIDLIYDQSTSKDTEKSMQKPKKINPKMNRMLEPKMMSKWLQNESRDPPGNN